jgi:hypothetical protein
MIRRERPCPRYGLAFTPVFLYGSRRLSDPDGILSLILPKFIAL